MCPDELFIPYVPAGFTKLVKLVKLVKVAKVADVISIDVKSIKTLKVEFQYIGNADGFVKHTLPKSATNWVERTKNAASKFTPG